MFKSMRLKNFKAYKDSGEVPLAPLTIIIGANNSGKSTLFQALLGLAQTVRDPHQNSEWGLFFVTKGLVDLNGYSDIVHGGNAGPASSFEISLQLAPTFYPEVKVTGSEVLVPTPNHAEFSFGLDDESGEIVPKRSALRFDGGPHITAERGTNGRWRLTAMPVGAPKDAQVDFRKIFPCLAVPTNGFATSEHLMAARAAGETADVWVHAFGGRMGHLGPSRGRLPWQVAVGARHRSDSKWNDGLFYAVAGGSRLLWSDKTLLEHMNEWLGQRKILKRIHSESEKRARSRVLLADECDGPENVNVAGMGEGISQILPMLFCATFVRNGLLLVEQPEIHLHPALQADLGDLFIEAALADNGQILVETHSEHLLLRVRRRIAEGSLKPDQVAILFVEKEHGESKIRRLDLNDRGHFSDWPKGFFDEAYQEAMALAEAASKKGR